MEVSGSIAWARCRRGRAQLMHVWWWTAFLGWREFVYLRFYTFICSCVSGHIYMYMHAWEARGQAQVAFLRSHHHVAWGRVWYCPGPHLAGWPMSPRDAPVSASPALGLPGVPLCLLIFYCSSGAQTQVSVLAWQPSSDELSPQPNISFYTIDSLLSWSPWGHKCNLLSIDCVFLLWTPGPRKGQDLGARCVPGEWSHIFLFPCSKYLNSHKIYLSEVSRLFTGRRNRNQIICSRFLLGKQSLTLT